MSSVHEESDGQGRGETANSKNLRKKVHAVYGKIEED